MDQRLDESPPLFGAEGIQIVSRLRTEILHLTLYLLNGYADQRLFRWPLCR
jgi:hypothetical protein